MVARRDVVRHPGSVVVLAVEQSAGEPRVLLVRQFRYASGRYLWELPAGGLEKGEPELKAARRELAEETGYRARHWKRILSFWPSPGFLSETMSIYLARGLRAGPPSPEDDERIEARFFSLSHLVREAEAGKIKDGKTLIGVLWLENVWLARKRRGKRVPA